MCGENARHPRQVGTRRPSSPSSKVINRPPAPRFPARRGTRGSRTSTEPSALVDGWSCQCLSRQSADRPRRCGAGRRSPSPAPRCRRLPDGVRGGPMNSAGRGTTGSAPRRVGRRAYHPVRAEVTGGLWCNWQEIDASSLTSAIRLRWLRTMAPSQKPADSGGVVTARG